MTWRLAKSLCVLLNEANEVSPNRDKDSDGDIGDASHQTRPSRHNPNRYGVVTALDLTHCKVFDTYSLFDYLRTHPHQDLAYVISNRRTASRYGGWKVKAYTGSNPHVGHIHVAVGLGSDFAPLPPYDDQDSWGLEDWRGGDMTADEVRALIDERLDMIYSPDVAAAQKYLEEQDIIARRHLASKAASVGYVDLLLSRVLRKLS